MINSFAQAFPVDISGLNLKFQYNPNILLENGEYIRLVDLMAHYSTATEASLYSLILHGDELTPSEIKERLKNYGINRYGTTPLKYLEALNLVSRGRRLVETDYQSRTSNTYRLSEHSLNIIILTILLATIINEKGLSRVFTKFRDDYDIKDCYLNSMRYLILDALTGEPLSRMLIMSEFVEPNIKTQSDILINKGPLAKTDAVLANLFKYGFVYLQNEEVHISDLGRITIESLRLILSDPMAAIEQFLIERNIPFEKGYSYFIQNKANILLNKRGEG